jgi:amidophosphoribosyltransferase
LHLKAGDGMNPRANQMCGVFGIYGHPEAANLTYLGLHALQHRGQESAGIATSDGGHLALHRGMGQVADVFPPSQLEKLPGRSAIGHVRYSTAGGSFLKNAQPIGVDYAHGQIAIAHNGNLTNAMVLREQLERSGSIFQSASDTEVIVHLLATSTQKTTEDRLADALGKVEGAYSLLLLTETKMLAVRDRQGIRPLCIGRTKGPTQAYVVSSEPASFSLIEAEFVRDVEPGEIVVFDAHGMRSIRPFAPAQTKHCIFEYIYFARPDSTLDGLNVYEARKKFGRALARENSVEADVVVPVPDSGVPATIGFSEASGIPYEMGLVRSHYVGRTFIEPQQSIRHFGVRLKLSPVPEVFAGKRVIVVDDSIVRGTTSRKIVKMIRDAGAKEVHMRISSPPTRWPCYYGIDTPNRDELIAASQSVEEINQYITSDSLSYLSHESMIQAVVSSARRPAPSGANGASPQLALMEAHAEGRRLPLLKPELGAHSFCDACFSGQYPIQYQAPQRSRQMRLLDI